MTNYSRLFFISALLLLFAGCAGVKAPPSDTSTMPGMVPQDVMPQQPGESVVAESKPVRSSSRAVIALLDQVQLDNKAGRREAAGTSLERALRIEPRNPWLWHELAQLRFNQGQYAQAISLARKSNSFAGHERHLQSLNWQLIGNARVAQGDSSGAEQAFKLSTELEQGK